MDSVAVLASGGLDSCVMLAALAESNTVYPVYVRGGQAWEAAGCLLFILGDISGPRQEKTGFWPFWRGVEVDSDPFGAVLHEFWAEVNRTTAFCDIVPVGPD